MTTRSQARPAVPQAQVVQVAQGAVTPLGADWGRVMGDAMAFWASQFTQGQQAGQSLVDAQLRWWTEAQNGLSRMWSLPSSSDLHVMPDSAGSVLCPPTDFTPAGLTRQALGAMYAMSAAWSSAVKHELEDIDEVVAHAPR